MNEDIMHILLKFCAEIIELPNGDISIPLEEHLKVIREKGKVICGQYSYNNDGSTVCFTGNQLQSQINKSIPTYVLFTDLDCTKLYVGKYIRYYNNDSFYDGNWQMKFIPPYYASDVRAERATYHLYIELNEIIQLDGKFIDDVNSIQSYNEQSFKEIEIIIGKNSNPYSSFISTLFYINLSDDFYIYLNELYLNEDKKMENQNKSLLDDFYYQEKVEKCKRTENVVDDKPESKPQKNSIVLKSKYNTNDEIAKKAIIIAKYCCEVKNSHKDFTSKVTSQNYVEGHHLIPMEYQDDFDVSIDVGANIISVCGSCHNRLHHAIFEERNLHLHRLYNERIERLKKCNIHITLEQLLNYYK